MWDFSECVIVIVIVIVIVNNVCKRTTWSAFKRAGLEACGAEHLPRCVLKTQKKWQPSHTLQRVNKHRYTERKTTGVTRRHGWSMWRAKEGIAEILRNMEIDADEEERTNALGAVSVFSENHGIEETGCTRKGSG